MPEEHARPEQNSDKLQGDKLDNVLGGGTGLTQDPVNKTSEPEPQQEPLK